MNRALVQGLDFSSITCGYNDMANVIKLTSGKDKKRNERTKYCSLPLPICCIRTLIWRARLENY